MANIDIGALKLEILGLADLIVAVASKNTAPVTDELSTREAKKEFGARWIDDRTKRGMLTCRRKGHYENSPKIYSRTECLALKEAERRGAAMIRKSIED